MFYPALCRSQKCRASHDLKSSFATFYCVALCYCHLLDTRLRVSLFCLVTANVLCPVQEDES